MRKWMAVINPDARGMASYHRQDGHWNSIHNWPPITLRNQRAHVAKFAVPSDGVYINASMQFPKAGDGATVCCCQPQRRLVTAGDCSLHRDMRFAPIRDKTEVTEFPG